MTNVPRETPSSPSPTDTGFTPIDLSTLKITADEVRKEALLDLNGEPHQPPPIRPPPTVITRAALIARVERWGPGSITLHSTAGAVADAIRRLNLEQVIAGRHDGKAVTFARAFELVFGERLTLSRSV